MNMLKLVGFLSALLAGLANADSQTVSVKFYGENSQNIPAFWPKVIDDGTNSLPGFVLMEREALDAIVATNLTAYVSAQSNLTWQAEQAINANIAALVVSYSNLQWCADNWAYTTNVTNLRVAVKACGEVLLKLKPVLKELYKGE